MADIRVEKKRSSVWMWIVAIIVVALLVWLVYEMFLSQNGIEVSGAALLMGGG